MTDKVDDYILVEEQPVPIRVGDKTIYVGNFTMANHWKFWYAYMKMLVIIGVKNINFELLGNGEEIYKNCLIHKQLQRELTRLIGKYILKQQSYYRDEMGIKKTKKWRNCSRRYFKNHITNEKFIQICMLLYLYNFDSEKKNLSIVLGQVAPEADQKELMETYMYFWLHNLAGLTGKFLLQDLPNVDSWYDDSLRIEAPAMGNKKIKAKMQVDDKGRLPLPPKDN